MDNSVEVRRSNRSVIKPIEFWNFEKPDYSKHEKINYSLTLSRLSESNISVATGNKSEIDASKSSRQNPSKNAPKNFSTNTVKRHNSSNAVSKKPRNASSRTNTVRRLNKSEDISKNSSSRADTIKRLNKSNDISKTFSSKNSSTTRLRKFDTSNKVKSNGEPQSETVPIESGSTRSMNSLLKISEAEEDRNKSVKNGVDKRVTSGEEERNADLLTDSSKNDENTEKILSSVATEDSYAQVRKSSEGNGFKLPVIPKQNLKFRKGFSFQQSLCAIPEDTVLETTDATCNATERSTVQQQKENRVFSKNDESAGQKEQKRCHEVSSNLTMSTIYDYSSLSVANESRGATRHSSRARTKPLEFWNFERTNISTTVDDQVSISIVKPNSPPEGKRKRSDMEPKILLQDKKSKKFQGSVYSSMQSPEKEDDTTSSTSGRCDWIPEKLIKFADLNFVEIKSADVNFYIARSYMEPALNLYAGFLFIAKGTLIWDVTQRTVVCVAHGRGILKTAETRDKGTKTILTNGSQIVIPKDCKATIIKDKRFKMLKLFIVLQN